MNSATMCGQVRYLRARNETAYGNHAVLSFSLLEDGCLSLRELVFKEPTLDHPVVPLCASHFGSPDQQLTGRKRGIPCLWACWGALSSPIPGRILKVEPLIWETKRLAGTI